MAFTLAHFNNFYGANVNIGRSIGSALRFTYSDNYASFVNDNGLSVSTPSMLAWAYLAVSAKIFGFDIPGTGNAALRVTDAANNPAWDFQFAINAGVFVLPVFANNPFITSEQLATLHSILLKAPNHVIEMVTANQVKTLSDENIESYYKMSGLEVSVNNPMKSISYLSTVFPQLITAPNIQAQIPNMKWLEYHTSYSGSARLINSCITDTGTIITWQANTVAAVQAALAAPWDPATANAIPEMAIAITYVYLEVTNMLPRKPWYQGNKAFNNLSAINVTTYRAHFARFVLLKNNANAVAALANDGAIRASLALTI